jgi:hypothetical protein
MQGIKDWHALLYKGSTNPPNPRKRKPEVDLEEVAGSRPAGMARAGGGKGSPAQTAG